MSNNRRDSQPSCLISDEENGQLLRLIGPKSQSMATAVAQVLSADPPNRSNWTKKRIGILCFIKDHAMRSYFFRMYCLDRQALVWEQELYSNFEYRAPRPYFHTFEGSTSRMGLSFADIDEAAFFQRAVNDHLRSRAEKLENRRRSQQQRTSRPASTGASVVQQRLVPTNPYLTNPYPTEKKQTHDELDKSKRPIANKFSTLKKKTKEKHKKLRKVDISQPMNFEHISHAGLNANQGFSLVNVDPELLSFFASAGVSEKQLSNQETREFIFDFIDKHGGREAAIREALRPEKAKEEAPVKRHAPATPQLTKMQPPSMKPPSPPTTLRKSIPQMAASAVLPPPPPPPPPPPMNIPTPHSIPLPPSLPLPVLTPPEAPPPPLESRSELFSAIRDGQKLKPVEETRPRLPSFNSDPKGDLLEQIRAGKELKHVERNVEAPPKESTADGIAGALARALQERSRVIHSDSDKSDQDGNEDDDWDDWEE